MSAEVKPISLRIYAGKALVSPGSLYKSVLVTPETTAHEVITAALERYGEASNPGDFELTYVLAPAGSDVDPGVALAAAAAVAAAPKAGGSVKIKNKKAHVLDADENPVLVIEWFSETNRRFELRKKEKGAGAGAGAVGGTASSGGGKEGLLTSFMRRASSIRSPRKESSSPRSVTPVSASPGNAGAPAAVDETSAKPVLDRRPSAQSLVAAAPPVELARVLPEANLPTVRKASTTPAGGRVSYL